jgi:hypothetical protein
MDSAGSPQAGSHKGQVYRINRIFNREKHHKHERREDADI